MAAVRVRACRGTAGRKYRRTGRRAATHTHTHLQQAARGQRQLSAHAVARVCGGGRNRARRVRPGRP